MIFNRSIMLSLYQRKSERSERKMPDEYEDKIIGKRKNLEVLKMLI